MPMRTAVLVTNPRWSIVPRYPLTPGYQALAVARSVQERLALHNISCRQFLVQLLQVRIPIYFGRVFRLEAGHRSDLKPATIPK
ncbi:hypothetical protein IVA90_17725 [Bradyrhizobium sp. 151]|nr:hypothetical protein [Bradyrhizobium sp. 151]